MSSPKFIAAILGLTALMMFLSSAVIGKDGTLRVGVPSLPASLGNPYEANGLPGTHTWHQIFDGLVKLDTDGQLAPGLARSWSRSSETIWEFGLRDDVVFSNGEPLTAQAVQRNFNWLLSDEGRQTVIGNEVKGIEAIDVVDPLTLRITTEKPDPILPNRLVAVMIVEPQAWAELGPRGFAQSPVGTGSYIVETWMDPSGAAVLSANTQSWRAPQISRLEIIPITEYSARLQASLSGQLDIAASMEPEHIEMLEKRNFSTRVDPSKQIMSIAFNVVGDPAGPLADIRVRQAVNYAVDKEVISDVLTYGTMKPSGHGAAKGIMGFNPQIEPYPYDPEKARSLLSEAGYENGIDLEANIVLGTYANDLEIYQKVQQDLANAGIRLTYETIVFSEWIRRYVSGNWSSDAFSLAWNSAPYNDSQRPMEYFSCRKVNPFFCPKEITTQIDAAAAELNPSHREALLQALHVQFHDQAPCLFLLEYGHLWAYADKIAGFELRDRTVQLHLVTFK